MDTLNAPTPDGASVCANPACRARLAPVSGYPNTGNYRWVDALVITLDGGYGQFIDCGNPNDTVTVVLCHTCGHKVTDLLGIDTTGWHTCPPLRGDPVTVLS